MAGHVFCETTFQHIYGAIGGIVILVGAAAVFVYGWRHPEAGPSQRIVTINGSVSPKHTEQRVQQKIASFRQMGYELESRTQNHNAFGGDRGVTLVFKKMSR